ncbi:MAG: hypothetical protein ACKO9S_08530, partial [Bacteroidota bacterium]
KRMEKSDSAEPMAILCLPTYDQLIVNFLPINSRSANRELIGKKFMLIYRTTSEKGKTTVDIGSTTTCNLIVFAKPL